MTVTLTSVDDPASADGYNDAPLRANEERLEALQAELIAWRNAAAQIGVPDLDAMREAATFSTICLTSL